MAIKLYSCLECAIVFESPAQRYYCTQNCANHAHARAKRATSSLRVQTSNRPCVNCEGIGANSRGFCCRKCDRDFNIRYGVREEDVAWEDRDD